VADIAVNTIYRVDPSDGSIVSSFDAPGDYCEGLAWDGSYLWASENGGGTASPDYLYKLDPSTGNTLQTTQLNAGSWPHGITWDGEYIWINNFGTHTITKINSETGEVLHSIPTPITPSIGLTWADGKIWTDDFQEQLLYCLNPEDGSVEYTVYVPYDNPRDLAFDGTYIWVLSAADGVICQMDVGIIPSGQDNPIMEQIGFSVFPNPANEILNIKQSNPNITYNIELRNFHGQLVIEEKNIQSSHYAINVYDLKAGVYFYMIREEYELLQQGKIVIK
jgi:outer membrane protein assembly factor BamB